MSEPADWEPATLAMNALKCTSVGEAISPYGSALEIKYDGWRFLTNITKAGDVRLYSRSGKLYKGHAPHLEEALRVLPKNTWLDAEAVAFNADGTQLWGGAQSVFGSSKTKTDLIVPRNKITLVLFDVMALDGEDLRKLGFRKRRTHLEEMFEKYRPEYTMLSLQLPATDAAHEEIISLGFEGSMIKRLDGMYYSGKRTRNWLKLKAVATEDVTISGFKAPKPGWIKKAGLIGSVEFKTADGVVGSCSGMKVPERVYFTDHQEELLGRMIEVKYMMKMPSGSLRHPNFVRFRPDLDGKPLP